jgi:dTDP-4-amino-4,6-dideoxygalactose transaminase
MSNVHSLVNRRKIQALEKTVTELTEVTTILKKAMQGLSKYNSYSDVKNRVNDLFVFYKEIEKAKDKKLEILERLKNEQKELE